jgi:hypothetical protein
LTDEAAVAVAEAYYAAFNEGIKTRSSKAFRALATKGCISCNKDAATIDALQKGDRTVDGGAYVFKPAAKYRVTHRGSDVFVGMVVSSQAATVKDADGHVVERFDRTDPATVYVLLHPRGRTWIVGGISK